MERAPQRARPARPRDAAARSSPCSGASASRARAASADRVELVAGVHDRAQQPLARGDQGADAGVGQEAVEIGLGLDRPCRLVGEHQHRGVGADAERPQPHRQLGLATGAR